MRDGYQGYQGYHKNEYINIHERDASSFTRRITPPGIIASDKWSGELIRMKNRKGKQRYTGLLGLLGLPWPVY